MQTASPEPALDAGTTMQDLLAACPGAQRALFARYHIGGCRSCGFRPDETLGEVCQRNGDLPVGEVIAHIRESHARDRERQIEPATLHDLLQNPPQPFFLLDVRTREEHESVSLPGARLFTQDLLQELMQSAPRAAVIVVYDHTGDRNSLDAAAYLEGHGFTGARALRGGIDAYSAEADPSVPRYRIEFEEESAPA